MTIELARRIWSDKRGVTATLFGLMAVVLMMVVGVALDSARLYSVSDKVRNGLDSAALAAAKILDVEDATDADVASRAAAFFETYRQRIDGGNITLTNFSTTTNRAEGTVTANVDVRYDTSFGKLFNMSVVNFTPSSTVYYKAKKIELSLVLDVTGSMNDNGRIGALKTAAKDLIDIMYANNPEPGSVRVSVIPYSSSVNVGSYFASVTGAAPGPDTCVVERSTMPGAVVDDAPGPGRWVETSNTTDNGQYFCPTAQILPLQDISVSSQMTAVKNLINSLTPDGWTAGHIGAAWGWYALSPNWQGVWPPASRPKSASPDVLKAVLLMTDGIFNTAYFGGNKNGEDYSVTHSSGDQAIQLCQNMRDAGVIVYTVAFEAPPAAEALLNVCAGVAGNAFMANSAADLNAKFRAIGERLSMLRISK
jgi:Flp pilus assembly protein TadG